MKKSNTSLRLKEYMQNNNLKQVDILKRAEPFCKKYSVKLGKNDLSQYVSGKVEPGQDKLFILAKTLDAQEAWLMGYDVEQSRNIKSCDNAETNNAYLRLKQGLEPYDIDEDDAEFLLSVFKVHKELNK
jgi:repressor LexA